MVNKILGSLCELNPYNTPFMVSLVEASPQTLPSTPNHLVVLRISALSSAQPSTVGLASFLRRLRLEGDRGLGFRA